MKTVKSLPLVFLLVFLGGALGVGVRFLFVELTEQLTNSSNNWLVDPIAVLICNLLACFLVGVASTKIKSEQLASFIQTGFLGGLSTLAAIDHYFFVGGIWVSWFPLVNLIVTFALGLQVCQVGYKLGKAGRIGKQTGNQAGEQVIDR